MTILETIANTLNLRPAQVEAVLKLLDEGGTIPFIARYRKEQTGSLDEDQLRAIEQGWKYQNSLQERKESIESMLEEKKLLTKELKASIEGAKTLAELEEIYRPYKEKRKTKASEAIAAGYGPIADAIWKQNQKPESLGDAKALEQAGYILAEKISDDASLRGIIRQELLKEEAMESTLKKDAEDPEGVYQTYYEFSAPLTKRGKKSAAIKPHQVLAMERGEKEKVLSVSISSDNEKLEDMLARKIIKRNSQAADFLKAVIHDALIRLMLPSIKREIRAGLRETAYEKAIAGFAANLEHLLMARPIKGQVLLSWDPGYRNGCKLAVLSDSGALLDTTVVYPFRDVSEKRGSKPNPDSIGYKNAVKETRHLLNKYHPTLIVIGNGTASRESVDLIAELLKDYPESAYLVGSEAGASVYSASELAKEEFPDLPVEKRSAVSIGRRIQDPLSELVKIDPKSLGIGEYQHDVPQKQLRETLDFVTDKAVNQVGVNINTASPSLLRHVSGLKKPQITKILKARDLHAFTDRNQLKKLLSDKTYEQAIGFLRVVNGHNPLDNTGIHPESYDLTSRLLQTSGLNIQDLHQPAFKKKIAAQNAEKLARDLHSDVYTIADILKELENPGLDPRDSLDGPILKKGVLHIEDLTPGMELEGTINNVTSFGAFVDIGLHENGLVHISQMADRFVSDPNEIVHAGQIVTVYVLETDLQRKRIALSMRKPR